MTRVLDIFEFIDGFAPFDSAMDFDNVGILVGNDQAPVKRCLLALDVTLDVIDEAKSLGASLIVSHHPVIFKAVKSLRHDSIPHALAKNDISVICAHTNLDMAPFGVNSCLAEALSLRNLTALDNYESKIGPRPAGLVGTLDNACTCHEFASLVKDRLGCAGLRYIPADYSIRRVAVCSGAGGSLIRAAIHSGVDAFVTGEIKHHEILMGLQHGICVIEAGHFKTEDVAILPLTKKLSENFGDVEFIKSKVCVDPMKYLV